MADNGPIQLSPLAQTAMSQLQNQFRQQMNQILEMDAEAQGIDIDSYRFNQQAGVWVPVPEDDEE